MAKKKKSKKGNEATNPLLIPVIILALLGAILGSYVFLSAEPPAEETDMPEHSGVNIIIPEDFGVRFYNETNGLSERNESFSPLGLFVHIMEFDSRVVNAYQGNASGWGNLEDLIEKEGIACQERRTLVIGTPAFHVFWSELPRYLLDGTLPNTTLMEENFQPMSSGNIEKNISNPFAILGFSMVAVSQDFNISVMPDLFEYNGSDILFFSSGFINESTIIDNNYYAIFESEFFVDSNKQMDLQINEIVFNRTGWFAPMGYSYGYEIELEGQTIAEQYSSIPINFMEIILNVANALNDLLNYEAES